MTKRYATSRTLLTIATCTAIAAASNANAQNTASDVPDAIVAAHYVTNDGTLGSTVAISLKSGKIDAVRGEAGFPATAKVDRYDGAVICPGFIDVRSSMGAYGNTVESAHSVDPGLSAIDSFDPDHRDFRRAVESGITAALIAPAPTNIVAGAAAIVKTALPNGVRAGEVLRDNGPLVFGFGPSTWQYDREPTSRIGAMAMLRSALADAKQGDGHPRLRSVAGGTTDAILFCDSAMDVSGARRLFAEYSSKITIFYNGDALDLVDELAGSNANIIVGPYDYSDSQRKLSLAGRLAAADVNVAFAARMPIEGGHSLRQTAALAVRYGMDSAKARQAMTINAAKAVGVGDRIGAIATGYDADLVIFSADPLRPDARVLAVYVDGVRVYAAHDQLASTSGGAQ